MGKRIVSLLLVFVLVAGLLPRVQAEPAQATPVRIEATVSQSLTQGQDSEVQTMEVNGAPQQVEVYDLSALNPQITVYYSDSSAATYQFNDIGNVTGVYPTMNVIWGYADQGGVWTVGGQNNLMNIIWGDLQCTARVTILENPVESVSINIPKSYIIGVDSREMSRHNPDTGAEETWMGYDPFSFDDITVTINYKNASPETLPFHMLYERFGCIPEYQLDSSQESWTAGSYTVNARYLGIDFSFTMTLKDNPVQSFTVETQGSFTLGRTDVFWDQAAQDEIDGYNPSRLVTQVHVTDNNGQITSYGLGDLYNVFGTSMDFITDQGTAAWGIGKHDVTAKFMGKEYTF